MSDTMNMKVRKSNTSRHTGISYHKTAKKYQVYTRENGKQVYVGLFADLDEAVKARDSAMGRKPPDLGWLYS